MVDLREKIRAVVERDDSTRDMRERVTREYVQALDESAGAEFPSVIATRIAQREKIGIEAVLVTISDDRELVRRVWNDMLVDKAMETLMRQQALESISVRDEIVDLPRRHGKSILIDHMRLGMSIIDRVPRFTLPDIIPAPPDPKVGKNFRVGRHGERPIPTGKRKKFKKRRRK